MRATILLAALLLVPTAAARPVEVDRFDVDVLLKWEPPLRGLVEACGPAGCSEEARRAVLDADAAVIREWCLELAAELRREMRGARIVGGCERPSHLGFLAIRNVQGDDLPALRRMPRVMVAEPSMRLSWAEAPR